MTVPVDDLDVRGHLLAFLTHELSAEAFHGWFLRTLWDIEQHASDDEADLAATVEHRPAEYTGGHIDEARPRAALTDDPRDVDVRHARLARS